MLYSCTGNTTVGIKGLIVVTQINTCDSALRQFTPPWTNLISVVSCRMFACTEVQSLAGCSPVQRCNIVCRWSAVCVQDKTARELALDADHHDVADYLLRKLFLFITAESASTGIMWAVIFILWSCVIYSNSVHLSVCPCHTSISCQNGWTYCQDSSTTL